jgi:hypothetical protein
VTGKVEILIDAADGAFLETDERWNGLRVRYRELGTRGAWSKFIVVASDGQSLRDLLIAAIAVVQLSDWPFEGGALVGMQLDLESVTA